MGHLVYLDDHLPVNSKSERSRRWANQGQSLIPLQHALAEQDINRCFQLMASFGRCSLYPRRDTAMPGALIYLIRISDAIALNQFLLESIPDGSNDVELLRRIDLIQMLENCEESLLVQAWDRADVTSTRTGHRNKTGNDSLQSIGQ